MKTVLSLINGNHGQIPQSSVNQGCMLPSLESSQLLANFITLTFGKVIFGDVCTRCIVLKWWWQCRWCFAICYLSFGCGFWL